MAIALGCVLALLAIVAVVLLIVQGPRVDIIVGSVFIASVGALLIYNGVRRHRGTRGLSPNDTVRFTAPYAFEIDDDALHFPGYLGQPAETWPRATTQAEVNASGSLVLAHEGFRRRTYLARVLARPAAETLALIGAKR